MSEFPEQIKWYYRYGKDPKVFEFGVTPSGQHFRIIEDIAVSDEDLLDYVEDNYPQGLLAEGSSEPQTELRVPLGSPESSKEPGQRWSPKSAGRSSPYSHHGNPDP
ncbi:hypothetical protein GF389_04945 [Candidatus Dojkabacteria bacterium]|nr:hypothetical protein [Candidatus Dojkabacteria bacterium]